MGFASIDQIINAITVNGTLQKILYQRQVPSTNVASIWHSLWKASGGPAAGGDPVKGLAGAAVCTDATTGALIPLVNAAGGTTLHLLAASAYSVSAPCLVYLVDRIAHLRLDRNQATGDISPALDATSRLAAGEGGQLVVEVTTQLGTTATTRTFDYTDQDDNAGTTPNITDAAAMVVGRTLQTTVGLFLPLASGDTGVRTVTHTTLGATGQAVGEYHLSIVRPLALLNVPVTNFLAEQDYVVQIPSLPRIYDDSCLMAYVLSATASATFFVGGEVRLASN